jgi:hypothetical protein
MQFTKREEVTHVDTVIGEVGLSAKCRNSLTQLQGHCPCNIVFRVGQNHAYTVYVRYFWLGNQITTETVIYGVRIRLWPTMLFLHRPQGRLALLSVRCHTSRVGQNHMFVVCIRYFWQGNHQIYSHVRFTISSRPHFKLVKLNFRFQFVRGSRDLILSLRAPL